MGEIGFANPKQDWRLAWSSVQRVEPAGRGKYRSLYVYTTESGNRPDRILESYAFDDLLPEIQRRMAAPLT